MRAKIAAAAVAVAALGTLLAVPARACDEYDGRVPTSSTAVYAPTVPAGHYETRVDNVWVEGRYQNQWTESRCYFRGEHRGWGARRHERGTWCEPGHYTSVWVPGHYEPVTRTVWVAGASYAQAW